MLARLTCAIVTLATIRFVTTPIVTALVSIGYATTGLGSRQFGQHSKAFP